MLPQNLSSKTTPKLKDMPTEVHSGSNCRPKRHPNPKPSICKQAQAQACLPQRQSSQTAPLTEHTWARLSSKATSQPQTVHLQTGPSPSLSATTTVQPNGASYWTYFGTPVVQSDILIPSCPSAGTPKPNLSATTTVQPNGAA
jgi:hypothetical protein